MTPSEPDRPEINTRLQPSGSSVSAAQLRFFQALCVLLLLALLAGGGYFWYRQRHAQPVAILVAGHPVVIVANYSVALAVIRKAEISRIGSAYADDDSLRTTQAIACRHVGDSATIDPESEAAARLSPLLHVTASAAVISINGRRAVALPDENAAQATLDAIQQHYVDLPPADPVYGKPTFQEKVEIVRERVPASLCKPTAADAAKLMLAPPKGKIYVVESGDTGWRIAHKFHLSLSAFLQANSGRDINRLAPGDTVNVAPTLPPITVVVQKQSTKIEPIIAGATDGTGGKRAITTVLTYFNGVRQPGSTPVDVEILQRATPRRVIE